MTCWTRKHIKGVQDVPRNQRSYACRSSVLPRENHSELLYILQCSKALVGMII